MNYIKKIQYYSVGVVNTTGVTAGFLTGHTEDEIKDTPTLMPVFTLKMQTCCIFSLNKGISSLQAPAWRCPYLLGFSDGKAFADPKVLHQLTSSVSCALDEAAQALTCVHAEQQEDRYVQ